MQFTLAAIIALLAALVSATPQSRDCPDSIKYGSLTLTPSSIATFSGEFLSVAADLTCTINAGITPAYLDYYVVNPSNANELPVLLSRHSYQAGSTSDSVSVLFPDASFTSGVSYAVELQLTYYVNPGSGGVSYGVVGTSRVPISIN